MDDAGRLLPPGEIGEVVIAGNNVTAGYENNPTANEKAFTNGWFRTGDQGRFDEDGYLFLTGRLKEIINRGGEKIAPREVDEILLQHPAVGQAVTFAVPHATLGEDVAAAVVLRKGAGATEAELRELAAGQLAEFKVPRQILFLNEIPKGPTGKIQRIGLADKPADQLAARQQSNFVAAQTSTEKDLTDIWKNVLKAGEVGVRDDFYALGGDSLRLTAMIHEVETRFKTEIPVASFLKSPTIERLTQLVENKGSSDTGEDTDGKPLLTDSALKGLKNRLFQVLALYAPGFKTTRVWLHRMRGVSIGGNVSIGQGALIETAYPSLVSLGNNVSIGIRSVIIAHMRDSTTRSRLTNEPTVRIEDDVYIGPGVIVLPNVTIGRGAVVSAGSVVSSSIPPHTLVRGNPAEPIARCGVSLGGGVSYEKFLRHLTPLNGSQKS
jgi:acetyltransferase-like isoleucine patch superfamily enzyme/acyl carrier protein